MPRWNVRNIATQSLPFSKVSLARASCAVFLLLETCLGLKINGAERKVTFTDPYLPEFLPELKMKGCVLGDATVDLSLARHESDVGINVIRRRGRVGVIVVK
jgi:hypothetical protein